MNTVREESDIREDLWELLTQRLVQRKMHFIRPTSWFLEQWRRFNWT